MSTVKILLAREKLSGINETANCVIRDVMLRFQSRAVLSECYVFSRYTPKYNLI
jgi:hypothetical protein